MRYLLLLWLLAIPQLAVAECTTTTIIGADGSTRVCKICCDPDGSCFAMATAEKSTTVCPFPCSWYGPDSDCACQNNPSNKTIPSDEPVFRKGTEDVERAVQEEKEKIEGLFKTICF